MRGAARADRVLQDPRQVGQLPGSPGLLGSLFRTAIAQSDGDDVVRKECTGNTTHRSVAGQPGLGNGAAKRVDLRWSRAWGQPPPSWAQPAQPQQRHARPWRRAGAWLRGRQKERAYQPFIRRVGAVDGRIRGFYYAPLANTKRYDTKTPPNAAMRAHQPRPSEQSERTAFLRRCV